MFKNYLKVALRNLWKSKGFSAINIIGLAAGLGVCILIVLYVVDELGYDRYIASLISFPIAWWAMNQWLQSFAYRIGISWWIFILAGVAALLIALLTVSVQTIRAAIANPVKSLRSE